MIVENDRYHYFCAVYAQWQNNQIISLVSILPTSWKSQFCRNRHIYLPDDIYWNLRLQ